ncbi:pre-mRNA-processing protein 40C isoform X2 [Tanacetum coccineum]
MESISPFTSRTRRNIYLTKPCRSTKTHFDSTTSYTLSSKFVGIHDEGLSSHENVRISSRASFLKEQEVERVGSKMPTKEAIKSYKALLEQEVEIVRSKVRRNEAIRSYQALLVETIKDSQISWTDAKPKLENDPQGCAANPHLDQPDLDKLFREHIKELYDVSATKEYEDGKMVFNSWSTAKRLLKDDVRHKKCQEKTGNRCGDDMLSSMKEKTSG